MRLRPGLLLALVVGLVLLVTVRIAQTQPAGGAKPRIGFLSGASSEGSKPTVDKFRQGLRELGWADGQNILLEYRWADGKQDRLPELAADLVRARVDVIVAAASPAARAAHQATRSIPIVIIAVGDPIGLGLAASLARPGGNVTGLASYLPELVAKILEVLKETIPGVKRVAMFWNPTNPLHRPGGERLKEAALSLAIQLQPLRIAGPDDFEEAYRRAVADGATAVYIPGDTMFGTHRARIAQLALDARLPTMYSWRGYVEAGGLIAYGPDLPHMYRTAATYVDKILKGAKPGDLPIEQPTKFELVINLKTAKTLGLTIPPSLLLRADQVIE